MLPQVSGEYKNLHWGGKCVINVQVHRSSYTTTVNTEWTMSFINRCRYTAE